MGIRATAQRFFHMATTSTPPAGQLALFAKNDDSLWVKKSSGQEAIVGGLVGEIPKTTINVNGSGWTGDVMYAKYGSIVHVWVNAVKASWATNDIILSAGVLPVDIRPSGGGYAVGSGFDAASSVAYRSFWIASDGTIRAAVSGTSSNYGYVSYQVPSVERSVAMASGAEGVITAGPKTTIGTGSKAYLRGGMVTLNLNVTMNSTLVAGDVMFNVPAGFGPAADGLFADWVYAAATEQTLRYHLSAAGAATHQSNFAGAAGNVFRGTVTYPAAISAAGLGTLVDTGWVTYGSINVPNIPCTTTYYKVRRVGNTVTMKASVTLTGAQGGQAYIDLPYPLATGTRLSDDVLIGRVRAIRNGVAWYQGDVCPERLSPGRAVIYQPTASGGAWVAGSPATWVSGDRWGFDIEYEAAPL